MFEIAELGQSLSDDEYAREVPVLRTRLLEMQQALKDAPFPVVVLISGSDGSGKGDMVNKLNEWMDPRLMRTVAFGDKTQDERERPNYWRFWRKLPARGRIGLYVGSWYSDPIARRVAGTTGDAGLDAELIRIRLFERTLIADGALVIKLWLHLSHDQQKARLEALAADPLTRWRVTDKDREHLNLYKTFRGIAEHTLRQTSTDVAPWVVVESGDANYRNFTVGMHILQRIQHHLEHYGRPSGKHYSEKDSGDGEGDHADSIPHIHRPRTLLGSLDLSQSLSKDEYQQQLELWQGKLAVLAREAQRKAVSMVIVLEGWDAAGKGGVIRRVIPALDARNYQVIPIAAPTDEEQDHHYLWRFWRHLPRDGKVTIYDRSWYGRVLVERVEGFASQAEWQRAFSEINDFESQLVEHGTLVSKFWLHIDPDVQLRRFKEREKVSYKRHKITDEDYRNRERWTDYETAVNEMVERTSTELAPWHMIAANNKRFARIKVLKQLCESLQQRLNKEDN